MHNQFFTQGFLRNFDLTGTSRHDPSIFNFLTNMKKSTHDEITFPIESVPHQENTVNEEDPVTN